MLRLLGVVDRESVTAEERLTDDSVFTWPHLLVRHVVVGLGTDAVVLALGVAFAAPLRDIANPNVIRASAGTVFAVPMAAAPTPDVIDWLRARQIRIVAAWVDADRLYTDIDLTGPLALAVGSEADGLTDPWGATGIERVRLPMHGVADSLNVSVSAAVLLYEARRQRDALRHPPD